MGQVGDHGAGRAIGAGGYHHAQADEHQLRHARRQGEGHRQQHATAQAIGDGQADLAIRAVAPHAVAQHAAQHDAHPTAQHDERRHRAGLVGAHGVVTVQVTGEPDDHRAADEQLQAAAHVGADDRTAGIQRAQRPQCLQRSLVGGIGQAPRGNARLTHDQRVEHRQGQAKERHAGKRPAPAQVLGHHAAQRHAQHRAEHATGHERAGQGGAHLAREHRHHHGDADAAVSGLADADQKARDEHLLVVLGDSAAQRGQAPHHRHEGQALDPADAVGEQGQRKGQQADHQGDDATEQAELAVAELPLLLQQGEHGIQHLPRHVVGDQQTEGQGKDDPGVAPGDAQ
ncbi:hypothetical protein D3C76_859260 [compost metagenome]